MRDIKFRAWNQHQKRMVFGPTGDDRSPSWVLAMCAANEMEPMQYTGLHDKNGKEIYEGDVLHDPRWTPDFEGEKEWYHIVEFGEMDDCRWGWNLTNYSAAVTRKAFEIHEVIGNIYSNPEILK